MLPGERIGEGVAEVERCCVPRLAVSPIPGRRGSRALLGHWHDLESETVEERPHLRLYVAPSGDDQRLKDGSGRDQQRIGLEQCTAALRGSRCVYGNFDERGRVDNDHAGRPLSS